MDYFPNNTLASFTTRLPEMLDLDGSWEIGLAEIQYPHSWYNVRINEVWVLFTDRHHEKHILVLPEGYYASPKRIVKALEALKHQKGMKKGFSLGMSEVDHKATLWVRDYWVRSDKTCLDLMVGLGNKYPKQLLNSAVHKVLFSDSTVKL
jgi:hypothetical protein